MSPPCQAWGHQPLVVSMMGTSLHPTPLMIHIPPLISPGRGDNIVPLPLSLTPGDTAVPFPCPHGLGDTKHPHGPTPIAITPPPHDIPKLLGPSPPLSPSNRSATTLSPTSPRSPPLTACSRSVNSRRRFRHLAAANLFLSRRTLRFSSSSGVNCAGDNDNQPRVPKVRWARSPSRGTHGGVADEGTRGRHSPSPRGCGAAGRGWRVVAVPPSPWRMSPSPAWSNWVPGGRRGRRVGVAAGGGAGGTWVSPTGPPRR